MDLLKVAETVPSSATCPPSEGDVDTTYGGCKSAVTKYHV